MDWPPTTVTYNNFGGEAGVQADEYRATPVVSALAKARSTAYTINVTASLQRWSTTPTQNLGWIFRPTADDGVTIYSSDFATVANHPLLTVVYEGAAGPTITTSVSSLPAFNTPPGTPSAAQTYTVSGSNLTADISITAPAGFEIKTDSGAYGSSLTLPQVGGVVNTTTISVRLTGAAEGGFSGNITHTSSGATTKNVAVSGTVS